MAITITWVVEGIDCYPSVAGQIDVAKTVRWRCNATDGVAYATTYGSTDLDPYIAGSPFTAFPSLTPAIVIGWIQTKMNTLNPFATAKIEAKLSNEILNPAIITPNLPW